MQHIPSRDAYRLDTPTHRDLRDLCVATGILMAAGVFAYAAGDRVLSDGGSAAFAAPAPAVAACGSLWDQDHGTGRADASVEAVATHAGLVSRGPWISRDGLAWEHVDGRLVVVANPRSDRGELPVSCLDADADDGSRA